ncbi:MAG TPA: response regulator [Ktedonobacterales bacterium]|nr:response regulator [Ktedonobacterales bacterium]
MITGELQAWTKEDPTPHVRLFATTTRYATPHAPREVRKQVGQDTVEKPITEADQVVVLIAEDEETIAETLAMIVEDAGFAPLVAHDGREALALAQKHRPDLIITDLMMPYLSGTDLIAAIRDEAAAKGFIPPPIMVVTAVSSARALEAQADAVVAKPFNVATVEAMMQRLLSGHQSSSQ